MPARSQRTPPRRFSASSFGVGLVVGVAVSMTTVYLIRDTGPSDSTTAGGDGIPTEDGAEQGEQKGAPSYEFFERLPAAEVSTDTEPYKTLTPGGYVEPSEYLVQAGSFRQPDDANRLRARLMLTGITADITVNTLDDGDGVWHRVVLGPFGSKEDAEQMVANLRQHDLSPTLRQVPPTG